jgi:TonB-dependent receptor
MMRCSRRTLSFVSSRMNVARFSRLALRAALAFGMVMAQLVVVRRAAAQEPRAGRIVGRIVDAGTGNGLTDVGVQIVGTTLGTTSGIDGRYAVSTVPAGTVTIQLRRLGYQPKTVTGILLNAGQSLEQNVSLQQATLTLQAQVVTASAERGTVNEALDRQRNATGITNAVTAEQIAKSPDANAAQAVQRVSGVTVRDGKYVFVRGLGERYTTTSLNGARLPSPDPEKKAVPLDLFPAGLLQTVTTSKTFTPDQPGDFSGAAVDIQTREFPVRRVVTYSASMGINGAATWKSMIAAPRVGPEWLGFSGDERRLPDVVRQAGSLAGLTRAEQNAVIRSFRNTWTPEQATGSPNSALGASIGGAKTVLGRTLGYVGSASYAFNTETRDGEERALAAPTSDSTQRSANHTFGETGRTSVQWGGLLNLSALTGRSSRIALNNMFSRTAENEAHADSGYLDFGTENPTRRTALLFVERTVRSNQLLGEHALGGRHNIDWSVTSSGVTRNEPDRADLVYVQNTQFGANQPFALYGGSDDGAKRSFSNVDERAWIASMNYALHAGPAGKEAVVKVGGQYRDTRRTAESRSYSIYADLPITQAAAPAEDLFRRYTTDTSSVFRPTNNSAAGSYNATDRVSAGYAMVEYPIGQRLRVIGGARLEQWKLHLVTDRLFANDQNVAEPSANDILPSLAINFRITESQSFRISASRTLSRPEYREVSPLLARDVIGEHSTIGNPSLQRALIENYDLRWEAYPTDAEVVSVALFAKTFHQPIERVEVATSGATNYSFVNADGASNFGVEVETRQNLGRFVQSFSGLTLFANATLMHSEIRPGNDSISALTSGSRPMVGQSPYVVNTGLTWVSNSGSSNISLLYNVVGARITAAASKPLPDTYEEPRHSFDLSIQRPLLTSVSIKFNGKNLLDSEYRETQGSVTRLRYRSGRVYSLGLTWRP